MSSRTSGGRRTGEQALKDGAYRFISPAYGAHVNERGETFENTLVSVALTNKPALTGMPAVVLASEERLDAALAETRTLDVSQADRDDAVKAGHALPDGSYPIRDASELHSAAVLAASHHGDYTAARALIRKRAGELGVTLSHLPGFAADGRGRTAALDQPSPDGVVTLSQDEYRELEQAAAERDQALRRLDQQSFDSLFQEALTERRVTPGQEDSLRRMHQLDAGAVADLLAASQPIMPDKPLAAPTIEFDPLGPESFDGDAAARAGVEPNSVLLDQQVRLRLRKQRRPMSDYATVTGEIIAEGGR